MKDVLTSFFPKGTRVTILPRRDAPRLIATGADVSERWRNSALFPGYSKRGRLFRATMRAVMASGLLQRPNPASAGPPLQHFLDGVLIGDLNGAEVTSVLIGTAGPTQMLTVEMRHSDGRIAAYAKYADLPKAIERLTTEAEMLRRLPADFAPSVLRFDDWLDGKMLLSTPIVGTKLDSTLPPAPGVAEYLDRLPRGGSHTIDAHPMIRKLLGRAPGCAAWLERLDGTWQTVVQHGDFAPWNLRQTEQGIRAFDWEYATVEGFPGFDLAYYWMQTQSLIQSAPPAKALAAATAAVSTYLRTNSSAGDAIVRLSMLDAFLVGRDDGHPDEFPNQAWRLEIIRDAFA